MKKFLLILTFIFFYTNFTYANGLSRPGGGIGGGGGFPVTNFTQTESFPAEGSTYEIAVESAGTSHTEGAWTQLAAATSFDAVGFYLIISTHNSNGIDYHIDIGTGAVASETAIIQNIPVTSGCPTAGICSDMAIYIPLAIANGTRVAARIQSTSTSKNVWMSLLMAGGTSTTSYSASTTYGADASDTGGTAIDPGGVANTKGSWTQITASTSTTCSAFWIFFGLRANADPANAYFKYDIGTGAGGAEVIKVKNLPTRSETTLDALHYFAHWVPFSIASSTRIAMRGQTDITDATDRVLDATIICFN